MAPSQEWLLAVPRVDAWGAPQPSSLEPGRASWRNSPARSGSPPANDWEHAPTPNAAVWGGGGGWVWGWRGVEGVGLGWVGGVAGVGGGSVGGVLGALGGFGVGWFWFCGKGVFHKQTRARHQLVFIHPNWCRISGKITKAAPKHPCQRNRPLVWRKLIQKGPIPRLLPCGLVIALSLGCSFCLKRKRKQRQAFRALYYQPRLPPKIPVAFHKRA